MAAGMHGPRHPFARAAEIAVLVLFQLGHQHGDALGRRGQQRIERLPRGREFLRIERSGLVCAEPMPGTDSLFEEFKAGELPSDGKAVYAAVLDGIREHLALAGEAGSLLLAERELSRWQLRPREQPLILAEPSSTPRTGTPTH